MVFGRGPRSFLTPPAVGTFLVSLVLAAVAIISMYHRIPFAGRFVAGHRFWMLAAAYVVLALGVVLTGL